VALGLWATNVWIFVLLAFSVGVGLQSVISLSLKIRSEERRGER
jgi:hypothetical protein